MSGVEVRRDRETLGRYARHRSPFVVAPAAVALPRDAGEVAECLTLGMPVTARAGGASVAGQCLGSGLVVDTTRMDSVGVEPDGSCWAGAGVVLDDLNGFLRAAGRMIG